MLSALAIHWPFHLNKSCNVLFLYCNQLSKASNILIQQVFSVCQREEMLFKSSKECQTMLQLLLNWTFNFYFSQLKVRIFVSATILCSSLHFITFCRERKSESRSCISELCLFLLCMETTGERIKEAWYRKWKTITIKIVCKVHKLN